MDSRIIKTADGSFTFFNDEYNEAYHSTKAGAYTESLYKFVEPCKIKELVKKKNEIWILDVGFGLGYNIATALKVAKEENSDVVINVISLEKDKENFNRIKVLEPIEELKDIFSILKEGSFEKIEIKNIPFEAYIINNPNLKLKVLLGEARENLKKLLKTNLKFDAVFYDTFSPKVNTEMWTLEIFKIIRKLMKETAILATYSASLAVRKGLIEAGFKIGLVEPVGRKSYSTVATINADIPPLTEKEKERLEKSPYAFPYRDNEDLSLPKEQIKQNWEEELKRRLNSSNC